MSKERNIDGAHRNRCDHHDFLEIILENEAHVEVLQMKLDSFEVDQLHVFEGDHHRRLKCEDAKLLSQACQVYSF
jgi:hypothetical protein